MGKKIKSDSKRKIVVIDETADEAYNPPQNVMNFSNEIEKITSTTKTLGESPPLDLFAFAKVRRDAAGK